MSVILIFAYLSQASAYKNTQLFSSICSLNIINNIDLVLEPWQQQMSRFVFCSIGKTPELTHHTECFPNLFIQYVFQREHRNCLERKNLQDIWQIFHQLHPKQTIQIVLQELKATYWYERWKQTCVTLLWWAPQYLSILLPQLMQRSKAKSAVLCSSLNVCLTGSRY